MRLRRLRPTPRLGPGLIAIALTGMSVGVVAAANLTVTSAQLTAQTKTYEAPVTCTLTASADSYVSSSSASSNFGTATTLQVTPDSAATKRAFVRFDLSACSPAIPVDALVQSAKLRLTTASLSTATRTFEVRRVTATWTESGVTWSNQPSAASVTASLSIPLLTASGTVEEWSTVGDVQAFVTAAVSDFGWRVADSAEGVVLGPSLNFGSREAASGRPQLVVTYLP